MQEIFAVRPSKSFKPGERCSGAAVAPSGMSRASSGEHPHNSRTGMQAHALATYSSTSSTIGGTSHELERWAGVAMATAVVAYGLSRRSFSGVALAAAAAPLAYRGVTGEWPGLANGMADTRVALAGDRGIHVRDAIRLEVPLEAVYGFWRRLENLPRFMTHLREVRDLGGGRSHWIADGPANVPVEWDAEIINEVPNKVIGWRSIAGSDIATAGSVHFSTARQGRSTQVSVNLQYAAPGGRATRLLAFVLGRDPAHMIREDLRRVKQLLEAGEIPRAARGAEA